jgi:hypothetical protein
VFFCIISMLGEPCSAVLTSLSFGDILLHLGQILLGQTLEQSAPWNVEFGHDSTDLDLGLPRAHSHITLLVLLVKQAHWV